MLKRPWRANPEESQDPVIPFRRILAGMAYLAANLPKIRAASGCCNHQRSVMV